MRLHEALDIGQMMRTCSHFLDMSPPHLHASLFLFASGPQIHSVILLLHCLRLRNDNDEDSASSHSSLRNIIMKAMIIEA